MGGGGARAHAHAADRRLIVAGQQHDIGAVDMEVELGVRRIAAAGRAAIGDARVLDLGDVVAGAVLRPGDAEVQADRPGHQPELGRCDALARQVLDQRHAAAVADLAEGGGERRDRGAEVEVVAAPRQDRLVGIAGAAHGGQQPGAFGRRQRIDPALVRFDVSDGPGCGRRLGHDVLRQSAVMPRRLMVSPDSLRSRWKRSVKAAGVGPAGRAP